MLAACWYKVKRLKQIQDSRVNLYQNSASHHVTVAFECSLMSPKASILSTHGHREKHRQPVSDYPLLCFLLVLCLLIPWAPSPLVFLSHLRLELRV